MTSTVVVTGASSGFRAMTVRALADAGQTVYAAMRGTTGRNEVAAADAARYAGTHSVNLRRVELDVSDQASVDAAVARIGEETGQLDVVHNAGHMCSAHRGLHPRTARAGPRHQRVVHPAGKPRRAAAPAGTGRRPAGVRQLEQHPGRDEPYLAPCSAAKAAEDSLAVSYAAELARFGIETTIVVPGSFTTATNHFANAGSAQDAAVAEAYEAGTPG